MRRRTSLRWLALATATSLGACQRGSDATASASASAAATPSASASADAPAPPATFGKNSVAAAVPEGGPMLGITSFVTIVYDEPRDTAKRIGYLRLGAKVHRSDQPVGTKGCAGGWYEIAPKGFVCAGKDATTNLDDPILLAGAKRPDTNAAMPYRYGFVRAVLPLYLKIPTADEQLKAEFKLKDHLDWYAQNKAEVDKVKLGAFDVPLDERGVPLRDKAVGEIGQRKISSELGLGELFGGASDNDPPPPWLAGGKRSIPNLSDFAVPETATFADRARRFSGFAFVGSFQTGEESLNRRFAITTDLRLAPTTKVKPDSGSPWHGIEIEDASELPLAFVREQGAVRYALSGETATPGEELAFRSVVKLSGKVKRVAGERYLVTRDGALVRASDMGLVVAPHTFPDAGERGEKWIEVNLTEQTLVMWEGKRPIYATLVSTGREEFPTVTGEFKIKNKHITATMDSNESSDVGGGGPRRVAAASPASDGDPGSSGPAPSAPKKKKDGEKTKPAATKGKPDKAKPAPAAKPASDKKPKKDPKAKPGAPKEAHPKIPKKGDGEYGVTKRRGEGTYALHDVPYIQYFAQGYALHAAYWHDVFGKRRSHGCVNLSPIDAHRVFMWTEPAVPDGWHAVNAGKDLGEGTTVVVHE